MDYCAVVRALMKVTTRPRLLDLFCGAGGAAEGYHRAGFEVVGVDIKPQPHYPFEFVQSHALAVLRSVISKLSLNHFAAIHASPPCQAFTDLKDMHNAKQHKDLLTPTRELLEQTGLPYVIENVEGAPLREPLMLCGTMFGLGCDGAELWRHRLFETNWPLDLMLHPCGHRQKSRVIGVYGGHGRDRRRRVNTHDFSVEQRREAMGIGWMTGAELSQAIPPAYTELIGHQLMQHVKAMAEAV
jgi:DNA (cytosine-5)-methyltransferase 1